MLAYYGHEISPNQTETVEGYLICRNVPIARTGAMEYLARELQLDGDPERRVSVMRYPEDVFEAAALASFEGKPVTDGHPPENVGPENYAAYEKGHVQNVRRSGEYVLADLYIKDPGLISDVRNGVKREVSCGYLCDYVPDGEQYRQQRIRGTHVAVVPRGRAGGAVSIKDAAAEAEKGRKKMSKFTRAILSAFGTAAKDAAPEEMKDMVDVAAEALEAAPAEKAQEAEPAEDVMAELAPKGESLESKLDKLIEMVGRMTAGGRDEEKKLSDEADLDAMIERLSGGEKLPDKEEAVTVPAEELEDGCTDRAAKDAAVELLKRVRPAVAAIRDRSERARVTDALLSAVKGPDLMGQIMRAAEISAKDAALANRKASYEETCRLQKSEYDARNPHKKKED